MLAMILLFASLRCYAARRRVSAIANGQDERRCYAYAAPVSSDEDSSE